MSNTTENEGTAFGGLAVNPRPQLDASPGAPGDDGSVAWFDATLDADKWFALSEVGPAEAALLLCCFNPHDGDSLDAVLAHALLRSTDRTRPEDFKVMLRRFSDAASAAPEKRRTLIEWLDLAAQEGLKRHPWTEEYLDELVDLCLDGDRFNINLPAVSSSRAPASAESLDLSPQSAEPNFLRHRTNGRRVDALGAAITVAMSKAADPAEWTSVWAELVSLARSPTRPAPLLGADEEGVKYESVAHDDGVAWLTRDALRMRITRTQPHANARKRTQK